MSRNGSGVYSLAAGNPVTTGTTISSSWANNTLTDIASALTASIASDGQTVITANLPMSTYAHTGVGVATARTMYGTAGQIQDNTLTYLTTVAGTNVITAVAPVLMSAYATGQTFYFLAAGGNTGAVTVNINAIGAKSVKKTDGSALVSGDILTGAAVQIMYDGTNFQLLSDSNGTNETVGNLTVTGTTTATGLITANGGVSGALNGSLGATTPSTVVATTLSTSGNVAIGSASVVNPNGWQTLTQLTSATYSALSLKNTTYDYQIANDNGVLSTYLGSTKLTTIDASGNLGLGVTPSAWQTNWKVFQFGSGSLLSSSTGGSNTILTGNAYLNSSGNYTYVYTNYATAYTQNAGQHYWLTAPSGTAGNAITFTQAMTLDASGNLGIGTASPGAKLDVQTGANTRLRISESGTDVYQDSLNATASAWTPAVYRATQFTWNNGSSDRMTLDASGGLKTLNTIGVGNATPSASGAGITFPATQSASTDANTLDDYEEGTWTPTFIGTTGATGQAYSVQVGTYTKVGRLITCTFRATLTTLGTLTGAEMCIGGLPFTSNSTANYYGANGSFGLLSNLSATRNTLNISVEPNSNIAYVMGNNGTSTSPYGYNVTSLWTATSAAWGSFTYLTA